MQIPVSTVVNVNISVGAPFPQRRGFGILNIVTAETGVIGTAERIRSYNNIEAVASDWGATSEVTLAATSYFAQNPRPTQLRVSLRADSDMAAELRGGSITELSQITAITNGDFNIDVHGTVINVTGLDLSGAVTFNEASLLLEAAIGGNVTVLFENNRFFIRTANVGASATIMFALPVDGSTDDASAILELQQGQATFMGGVDAETVTEALTVIDDINSDWYGLMFTREVRDGVIINGELAVVAAASWVEARVKVLGNTTNDIDVLDSVTDTDIASVLSAMNLRRTMTTFSNFPNQYPSASILGRAFTVNFDQPDSTITLKFKQMPTITVEDLTQNQKAVLDGKSANALIEVGSSDMFAESFMANGTFFDETHGLDWLTDAIQTNVFGYLLTRPTKVPYTDAGVAALEQQVIRALDAAVLNGLLAAGETQDGVFLENGYRTTTIPVDDVDQSSVDARIYPGLSFIALGAGAIHNVTINGIFER